jgi:nucleoside-diphosphate-sugar epimerase
MRIALTGGSGLVGSEIIRQALMDGHEVVSIDRVEPRSPLPEGVEFRKASITDYQAFEDAMRGCDALIHMAAYPTPLEHPDYEVHNNNVVGSYNALSAAARLGIKRVCQASSVNALGASYSRKPRYDYFPLDEQHPTYNEDPYSLSKWICEAQADSFTRRYEDMVIASMRFHWVASEERKNERPSSREAAYHNGGRDLWAYTNIVAAARACLLSLTVDFTGHEVFYIVAPETVFEVDSRELAAHFYPNTEIRGEFAGRCGFYDCSKAERILGWRHNDYV